jgi:hypothetical protein
MSQRPVCGDGTGKNIPLGSFVTDNDHIRTGKFFIGSGCRKDRRRLTAECHVIIVSVNKKGRRRQIKHDPTLIKGFYF